MPEQADFDAYYKWLGIPPHEQPPNFYRLLGVVLYESDPDVIEAAADQRMAHIRTYQTGKHGATSQKVLNELADARLTLLDPSKKAAYDARLREQALAASAALAEPTPVVMPTLAVAPLRSVPSRQRPNYAVMAGVALVTIVAGLAAVYAIVSKRPATERKVAAASTPPKAKPIARPRREAAKPEPPVMPPIVVPPKPSVEPSVKQLRILDRKTGTYLQDGSDVANGEDGSFMVSTSGDVGAAAIGYELEGTSQLNVDVKVTGTLRRYDENSFAGIMLDYHTPAGYVSRVALGLGLYSEQRFTTGPEWGKQVVPDRFVDVSGAGEKELNLKEWAPADWDGRVWFSVLLQNSGAATSIEGRLILPPMPSDDAQERESERDR